MKLRAITESKYDDLDFYDQFGPECGFCGGEMPRKSLVCTDCGDTFQAPACEKCHKEHNISVDICENCLERYQNAEMPF